MQKLITLTIVAVVLIIATGAAIAEEVDHQAKLAEMEGIDIYKNVCKSCHGPDADAGEYTPMDLIMEQWDDFFQDTFVETHTDITCPSDETQKLTDVISGDVLKKVQKFCVDHAADSEQPMTCG
jgi:hypothetical protein